VPFPNSSKPKTSLTVGKVKDIAPSAMMCDTLLSGLAESLFFLLT
jgi:hypothetical protein